MTREKVEQRLRKQEVRYDRESRMKKKWSENLETLEEVFDRRTIMTVLRLLNTGKLKEIHGVVKSGKESRVYRGTDREGDEVAIKIYLTTSAIFRQGRRRYLTADPRFKEIPHSSADVVDLWALKEYKNLKLAHEAGIPVPRPIAVEKNVLVLGFIGKDGQPAPLLREVPLSSPSEWYRSILDLVDQLYKKAELVHGDLSEYNIMIPNGYPV
ncbi:MAG TPA: RIO1 family regulatory kinase/ATPase, partial [Candidatus Binatus sp.]|nr:RIO1 family regulatory kinase/ATPase [Candidatus Binatus sp.]